LIPPTLKEELFLASALTRSVAELRTDLPVGQDTPRS
jgi:hypothetical protein